MAKLERLFQPIKISNLELKNRIVMLAMGVGCLEPDNTIGDRYVNYFAERAKGGAGLIIVSCLPLNTDLTLGAGLYHDRLIPGARRLVDAVHAHGARIAAQLLTWYHWKLRDGGPSEAIGPSPVPNQMMGFTPRALTVEEIHRLVNEYGEAARRAREAGFDLIELHLGMGFVLNRFMSPLTNQRSDEYGGSLENRLRIVLEIIEKIKQRVGRDFPLSCRISADEFMEGGNKVDDYKQIAPLLEKAGTHVLDVEAGWEESPKALVQHSVARGAYVYLAEAMKKVVKIPVITAYRINQPEVAEKILAEGKADLIGLARPLNADPEFPNKAREGRLDEVRNCVACCECLDKIFPAMRELGKPYCISCSVNPVAGREEEYAIKPAERAKKVLVIGGGPAGMEAARVAALRGHKVTLYEKTGELGGNLLMASVAPYKEEIDDLTGCLAAQVKTAGVDIRLNTEATLEFVKQQKPDAMILATGASLLTPDIPGVRGENVVSALDVLAGRKETGERVVIVGGGMIGCETAEFLAKRGKKVAILEMLKRVGSDIGMATRWVVLDRLKKAGVIMVTQAQVTEITANGVNARRNEATEFFPADTVIIASGLKSENRLVSELKGTVKEVHAIGDCVQIGKIGEALKSAYEVGLVV